MNWKYIFRKQALKWFAKLDKINQERLIKKLDFFISSWDPLKYADKLTDPKLWTYKFRIGKYRLVFDINEEWKLIILLVIDLRGQVYKNI